jgi:ribitol-5-phosphate 2-dehydrogenase
LLSRGFKIVSPKTFEIYINELSAEEGNVLVKIDRAAICKADLRYYLGTRDKRILGLKYPMNLLHEAIGTVVKDDSKKFKPGEKVTLVPNIAAQHTDHKCAFKVCSEPQLGENYCPESKFASSNFDGFSSEYVNFPVTNVVSLKSKEDDPVLVFCELVSVVNAAIRRIGIENILGKKIAIWGDGILGYITSAVLKYIYNCNIVAVGKHFDKLEKFPRAEIYLAGDERISDECIEVAFECVGGMGSQPAINEIIDSIIPGGNIILTGVSENNVEINTRKILEKGLCIYGTTRSSVKDFEKAVEFFQNQKFYDAISSLVIENYTINNIVDLYNAFESELSNTKLGKYVLKFDL